MDFDLAIVGAGTTGCAIARHLARFDLRIALIDAAEDVAKTAEIAEVTADGGEAEIVSRDEAHREGIRHRTAHVWLIRKTAAGYDILLQKRSRTKESYPGLYGTSSAGHIPAGEEPLPSALRELVEELGIHAAPEELTFAGAFTIQYEQVFHDRLFRDHEVTSVFVYRKPVDISALTLQESEVEAVRWFDLEAVWTEIQKDRRRICVPTAGLRVLREFLRKR